MKGLIGEIALFWRFFGWRNKEWRRVVFYSEGAVYFQYFEGLIASLLKDRDLRLSYITSDKNDPLLKNGPERMRVFHFKKLLPFVLYLADAKVIVMTMTDLNKVHIVRSSRGAHHVYVFHSMVSTHMTYRRGAFDHYDTIFCVGPHHVDEIQRMEEVYQLPRKALEPAGYYYLEKIHADHQAYLRTSPRNEKPLALIAPSWGESNILETCIRDLVDALDRAGYRIRVRPHPETAKRRPDLISNLKNDLEASGRAVFEDLASDRSLHQADVLVTDWSGIAMEYAFGTERPVLFVDVPKKVRNPDYEKVGLDPLEVKIREEIGRVLSAQNVREAGEAASQLILNKASYQERIRRLRNQYVFDFGKSSEKGAAYIAGLCRE